MRVFFCEKPSVGRLLADALHANDRHDGYITGDGIAVTWGFGHLVGIAEPAAMNETWDKPWRKEVLPMIPDPWKLTTISGPGRPEQYQVVKNLFDQATEVVCATDAGREGELIFRYVYLHSGCQAPAQRFWVSDLTKASLEKGLSDLKPAEDFDNLFHAARLRSQADWLLGLNATRAFTLHHGLLCTVGRVQTPTLAMVAAREEAVTSFAVTPFWEVTAQLCDITFKAATPDKNRFSDKAKAEQAQQALSGQSATVLTCEHTEAEVQPPQLFDLAALQTTASKELGLTAAETLALAQRLYERQAISYPRIESRHLSANMVAEFPKILAGCPKDLKAWVPTELPTPGKRFIDDTKLTDHHAVIPTGYPCHDEDALPLYRIIWQRFLAMFAAPKIELTTEIVLEAEGGQLVYKGKLVQSPGWSAIEQAKDEEAKQAPADAFEVGRTHVIDKPELVESKTQPPKPYTDGTLISAMKNVGRTIEDAELAAHMGGGLGTPATRAEIIEKLIRTGLMLREKKNLFATPKGKGLLASVVPNLKTPELTAEWETSLSEVEQGQKDPEQVYTGMVTFVQDVIPTVWETERVETGLAPCPKCGDGSVRETKNAYGCTRWRDGCKFTIWRTIAGKKIQERDVKQLLEEGKTRLIRAFKSRKGDLFNAHLVLDGDHQVKFHFPPRTKAKGKTKAKSKE